MKWFLAITTILTLSIFPVQAQVNSDYWAATDALGRRLPSAEEVGARRPGKYIAMFYWTWHTDQLAAFSPVMNVSEILRQYPEAADDQDHPAWQGIWGGVFWWDEPLFGYYRTTDEWVLRKHAELLADAGVDVVFFDCTNGSYTWKSSYTKLLQTWAEAREDGVNTPQVAFMLPFSATDGGREAITQLYTDLYKPGLHKELWFYWKGKPIIMAYPEMLKPKMGDTAGQKFAASTPFRAIDVACPSWSNNIGSLTLKLYKWDTVYWKSVFASPLAETTFVNFEDNARLALSFDPLPAGDYLWELSHAREKVGVWKFVEDTDSVTSYFNRLPVEGDYDSRILTEADGSFRPLTSGSYATHLPIEITPGYDEQLMAEIRDFFTFRPGQPDYVRGPTRSDQWGWLEIYPQHGYAGSPETGYEQVTVGVAQNASDASDGRCYAFNSPGSYGRSYTQTNGQDSRPDAYLYGLNFAEQWQRAFELDPELVFVTGWNEWIAGRYETWSGCVGKPYPMAFPDEYNWDKSRDLEPVKSWGDFGDVYYLQLVSQVRRFKGMDHREPASPAKTIDINSFDDWDDVRPLYRHYRGNTKHRSHRGQGNRLYYVNESGRNDIVLAKVARDNRFLYFYVEAGENLTPATDPNWMRLFIDIDRDKSTGWNGYDFVVNRLSPADSAIVEKNAGGWSWEAAGSAAFSVKEEKLQLKISRSILAIEPAAEPNFEFKWSDNCQTTGNIMDFYTRGDAAPGGRFNFVYAPATAVGVNQIGSKPFGFALDQNYPNPFNPETTIQYELAQSGHVELSIYDLTGRRIEVLVEQVQNAGQHRVTWSARHFASGIYLSTLKTGKGVLSRKMALIK